MPASEAQIRANKANSLHSTGPKSISGKEKSRSNALKHGLTGAGVVLLAEDAGEVDVRSSVLMSELSPQSALGAILVRQIATLSVRMERGERQESETLATRVRHAPGQFDRERLEHANRLFQALADDPRDNLRELRKLPEGVDRLLSAWADLRDDLTLQPVPVWSKSQMTKFLSYVGLGPNDPRASVIERLTIATHGSFYGLAAHEGGDLEPEARKGWARARLLERIDAEIADLVNHRATLDLETIALDRAGAADRALFDSSHDATLARRYESEARRGFFKSLDQLRKVEAEAADRMEPTREPELAPEPVKSPTPDLSKSGSFRTESLTTLFDPLPTPAQPLQAPRIPSRMAVDRALKPVRVEFDAG